VGYNLTKEVAMTQASQQKTTHWMLRVREY